MLGSVTAANIVGTLWTYEVIFYGHFAEGAEKFTAGRHRGGDAIGQPARGLRRRLSRVLRLGVPPTLAHAALDELLRVDDLGLP